jgi:hypothetical protein
MRAGDGCMQPRTEGTRTPHLVAVLLGVGLLASAATAAPAPAAPVEVELTADLGGASLSQVEIVRRVIEAARIIEDLYHEQVEVLGFYPDDMSPEEFGAWEEAAAASPYTLVRRDAAGELEAVPYHELWPGELGRIARLLAEAAELTDDEGLRHYLTQRARALIVGDYRRAEQAWQAMRYSDLEVLIGPIGKDDDAEYGLKAAFGAYLLIRDWAWGARLAGFSVFLPELQHELPVSAAFKAEVPEVEMKVAVYDLLYHAGYGAARIGVVAPDTAADRRVRLERGPRRLQLRNVMRARFDALVRPAAEVLLAPEERRRVGFEPFFLNTMLHEMAHELGVRETVTGRGPVRAALGEYADVVEEAKASVLSLWMVERLQARGELPETGLADHYASFLAGLFRTVQLDGDSPAGQARLLVFNFFRDWGAIRRQGDSGHYHVDADAMAPAIEALAAQLLTLQGSGDREGAALLVDALAWPRPEFRADLERLDAAGVPAAIVFRQGESLLGL